MQQLLKKLICLTLISMSWLHGVVPFLSFRSQGVNAARELVGQTDKINLSCKDSLYVSIASLFEYNRSFHGDRLANTLFGSDLISDACSGNPALAISGSQTANRRPTDWLADYFGLPTDFQSVVTLKPLIQNFIVDFNFYFGLDDWCPGLYFRIDAPIVNTKWNLDINEQVLSPGSNEYPAGYFSASPEIAPYANFTEYTNGGLTSATITSTFDPLANAKLSSNTLEQTNLAELRAAVGWNYTQESWHTGFNIRFAAPTGTKPQGVFAFEPVVGNGHHWEAGVGLTGHWTFWNCDYKDQSLGFYIDANVTHMFKARQRRTFDLRCKPNSRYMLAQEIQPINPTALTTAGTPFLASAPFPLLAATGQFTPVANLTTFNIDSSIAIQADAVLLFNYSRGPLSLDLGYNFWGRMCEHITPAGDCPPPLLDGSTWALKGDASIVGFVFDDVTPVNLAPTESAATIHGGTNFPASGTTNTTLISLAQTNPNIDTATLAIDNSSVPVNYAPDLAFVSAQTHSSLDPLFLSLNDIDYAGTSGYSNKLFAHFSYTWIDIKSWTPFLGFGGEVEFGYTPKSSSGQTSCNAQSLNSCASNSSCNTQCGANCNTCARCQACALSQWGLWLKGGISFN